MAVQLQIFDALVFCSLAVCKNANVALSCEVLNSNTASDHFAGDLTEGSHYTSIVVAV